MAGQVQVFSQDRNLHVGMSIAGIKNDNTKTDKEKAKLIELFNRANTTPDAILDLEEIRAYDASSAKENSESKTSLWKKIAIGAGIAIGTGIIGYLAYRGIKHFKNTQVVNGMNSLPKIDSSVPELKRMMTQNPETFVSSSFMDAPYRYLHTSDGRRITLFGDKMHEVRDGYQGMKLYNANTGEVLQDTLESLKKRQTLPKPDYRREIWNPTPVSSAQQKADAAKYMTKEFEW